jgi:16S rRNA G966 N2-methylase RsmD
MYVYGGMASFYRASKLSCEAYIEAYQRIFGLPYTILRFGSLYGPRADERNGIYGFLHQALTKKSITYWGDGEEIREYIHVRDAAESCVDALAKKHENACLILTGHQSMKIRDLLAMIREILGDKIRLIYKSRSRPDLRELHYRMTPYAYLPQEARKLVRSHYVDLYCGVGAMALLAAKKARFAFGVEPVRSAIYDARENAKRNHLRNVDFVESDCERFLNQRSRTMEMLRDEKLLVIVDPPRSGCTPEVIQGLLRLKPERMVYVSCHPATLARDIKLLSSIYKPSAVTPVDLFPQTSHIETVVRLERR